MLLVLETMGCGRSKQQSPTNGGQEIDGAREKPGNGKKKRLKGDKKENRDPKRSTEKAAPTKQSPSKSPSTALKVPMCTINGSSQNALHVDVEFPPPQDNTDKTDGKKTRDSVTTKQTNIKVTSSQLEFFKMLDEKIEQGREYSKSQDELNVSTP